MINRDYLTGCFILLISILMTLILGEIIIRYISSEKLIYNVEMVKYAKKLKISDPNKLASHIHKKNSSANLMGVEIRLNNMGHRSRDLDDAKQLNEFRTFILGSSVTMGWGVKFENVFSQRLEQKLNNFNDKKYTFANGGIGNYNNKFQHELFKQQYQKINPDLVLLHYFISDAEERPIEKNNFIYKHSYLAAFLYDRLNILRFMFAEKNTLHEYYNDIYKDDSKEWKNTINRIKEINSIMKSKNKNFLLMIVPDFHNLNEGNKLENIYNKIEKKFNDFNISVINTYPLFQNKFGNDPQKVWIQKDDPHPNHLGHRIMADELFKYYKIHY